MPLSATAARAIAIPYMCLNAILDVKHIFYQLYFFGDVFLIFYEASNLIQADAGMFSLHVLQKIYLPHP